MTPAELSLLLYSLPEAVVAMADGTVLLAASTRFHVIVVAASERSESDPGSTTLSINHRQSRVITYRSCDYILSVILSPIPFDSTSLYVIDLMYSLHQALHSSFFTSSVQFSN